MQLLPGYATDDIPKEINKLYFYKFKRVLKAIGEVPQSKGSIFFFVETESI